MDLCWYSIIAIRLVMINWNFSYCNQDEVMIGIGMWERFKSNKNDNDINIPPINMGKGFKTNVAVITKGLSYRQRVRIRFLATSET